MKIEDLARDSMYSSVTEGAHKTRLVTPSETLKVARASNTSTVSRKLGCADNEVSSILVMAYHIYYNGDQTTFSLENTFSNITVVATTNETNSVSTPFLAEESSPTTKDPTYVAIRSIQKYVIPVLCVTGLVGNLTSVGIFMSRSLKKKSCCMYLLTKCLTDTLFLVALFIVWLDR